VERDPGCREIASVRRPDLSAYSHPTHLPAHSIYQYSGAQSRTAWPYPGGSVDARAHANIARRPGVEWLRHPFVSNCCNVWITIPVTDTRSSARTTSV